jgi:RNA polymerase sigma-70 factor, ECF subfamily
MSGFSGVLAFPPCGGAVRVGVKLEHRQNNEDATLVRRIQQGDELAFREIVDRYQTKVYSIIYGILRNRNDAEDIAQQVFTKVFFSIGRFDSRSALLTWIYKITVNECYDYLRKRRVRRLVYESDFSEEDALRLARSEPAVDAKPSVESDLARRDYVIKLLSRISSEDRNLLLLKEVEGHSVEELAEMTGMNQNTVKVKLFRARQKLLKAARRMGRHSGETPA